MASHQPQSGQHWHVSLAARAPNLFNELRGFTHIHTLIQHHSAVTQLFQLPSLVGTPDRRGNGANYLDFQRDPVLDWSEDAPHILLSQRLASIAKL